MIKVPFYVKKILDKLNSADYEAYVVGGCVRDSIRDVEPLDWDVCTSAHPQQIINIFAEEYTVIPTGLKHGTITVLSEKHPIEITTYRYDGQYSDNRHPHKVEFIKSINDDLARRDFTMNAIAYHPTKGMVDLYGGIDDINNKIIRCVGIPEKRFEEDALRILRALRFAAVCNFDIEKSTENAIFLKKNLINNISTERIFSEMKKLLLADSPSGIILKYKDIFNLRIPVSENKNDILIIDSLAKDISLRMAAMLGNLSYTDAQKALRVLKADNNLIRKVGVILKKQHITIPKTKTELKHLLREIGVDNTKNLFAYLKAKQVNLQNAEIMFNEIIKNNECYSLYTLNINGFDLISAGIEKNKRIGEILNHLLDRVINDNLENEKAALIQAAAEYKL